MQSNTPKKKARFIKPLNRLKTKVGSGGIDQKLIIEADHIIDENNIDFAPYALKILEKIGKSVDAAQKNSPDAPSETFIKAATPSIMQIKAHGSLFHYHLLGDVADNILHFLEHTAILNNDSYKLIEAHLNTMLVIVRSGITGDGAKAGDALMAELTSARDRYEKKYCAKDTEDKKTTS